MIRRSKLFLSLAESLLFLYNISIDERIDTCISMEVATGAKPYLEISIYSY